MTNSKTVPCLCSDAGAHPDGDTVTFKETIGFRELATAQRSIYVWREVEGISDFAEILMRLSELYLLHFIESWTLLAGKRKLPVTPDNVRERLILANPEAALDLAEVADALYRETVLLPLVRRVFKPSPTTLTNGSTSANGAIGRKPTRSKRSSTSTSLTADTVTMP